MTSPTLQALQENRGKVETIAFAARPGTREFLDQYRADTGARSISEVLRNLVDKEAITYERAMHW